MRIISGQYRGRKLNTIKGNSTRPTTDRVKESLFNILQFRVRGSVVLDLFAGSGALGIECLSRGAKYVTFCDSSRDAVEMIYKNLKGIDGKYIVVNSPFERVLKTREKYDIIFVDAPYNSGLGQQALTIIAENRILNDGGIISYERLNAIDYTPPKELAIFDSRKYGDTVLDFLRYEDGGTDGQL